MSLYRDPEKPRVAETLTIWNRSAALESVGDDEGLLQEVINAFLMESPKYVAQIEQALLVEDHQRLEFAAHSLKGSLGYLGVPEASQMAQTLESAGRAGEIAGAAELFAGLRTQLTELWTELGKCTAAGA